MKKVVLSGIFALIALVLNASTTWTLQGSSYKVDTLYHAKVGPGTTQTSLKVLGPVQLRVFYTVTDLANANVDVKHVMARDMLAGLETVSSMAKSRSKEGQQYFVGINADFFSNNKPVGSAVVNKEVYYAVPWRTQWAIDANKKIHLGDMTFGGHVRKADGTSYPITAVNYDRNENNLTIYTPRFGATTGTNQYGTEVVLVPMETNGVLTSGETKKMRVRGTPATAGNMAIPSGAVVLSGHGKGSDFVATLIDGEEVEVETIVQMPNGEKITPEHLASGCPMILSSGKVLDNDHLLEATPNRHPRTAVGYDKTGTKFIMLVVDGRSSISAGAYPKVLADIMREVGCTEAMNFDGGGSSTLYVQSLGIRNVPCDGSERTVTNGVYLVANTPTDTEVAEIRFADWEKVLPKHAYYKPTIYGYNKYGVLVDTDVTDFVLSCPEGLGEIIEGGKALSVRGVGSYLLEAVYKGEKTSIVVKVDDSSTPKFRHSAVLLDSYSDYKVDVYATIGENDFPLDNSQIKWTASDETVVSIGEGGILSGLSNGITKVVGEIGEFSGEIEVKVEIPLKPRQSIDKNLDVNSWSLESENVENTKIESCGNDGFAITYTTTSARGLSLAAVKDISTWARPDSLVFDINPAEANLKNIYLYFTDYRTPNAQIEYQYTPTLVANNVNRVAIPMDKVVNVEDMSSYPLILNKIKFVPGNKKGTTHRVEFREMAWVYNSVPEDASGLIENFKQKENLILIPNPVKSGEVVKLGVTAPTEYSIYSLSGVAVAQGKGVEFSTEDMSAGFYLVKVHGLGVSRLIVK